MRARWDIFCAVVDNYGDIATCWRLARLLVDEHGQHVRLWVDDLATMRRLAPEVRCDLDEQWLGGIEVRRWPKDFPVIEPAEVVVEAFACDLPAVYREAMRRCVRRPVWVNLEYFSAEDWVAGCHGLSSIQRDGLTRHFFFPGIQSGAGGVLREADLLPRRDAFMADAKARAAWCTTWGVPAPEGWAMSLFSYEHPALPLILRELCDAPGPVTLYVPEGRSLNSVREAFPETPLAPGGALTRGRLRLHVLPFLPQTEYDCLLWLCDLNIVRGEESLARALWSGRPFLWHVYPTEDCAHMDKLEAFVTAYAALDEPGLESFGPLMRAWNKEGGRSAETASGWFPALAELARRAPWFAARAARLARGGDLSAQLVKFVTVHYNAAVKQPLRPSGNTA
ncbi:MAG: elongation factor P maturation arginine rhamnosyltransferase EarP [Pseudomonadota bacterium]